MDHGPLVKEEIEAGAEIVRRFHDFIPVEAAFWLLRGIDEGYRYLYIAVDGFEDRLIYPALDGLMRILDDAASADIDRSRVTVIRSGDPLARAAIDMLHRYPQSAGHRQAQTPFGGGWAEDLYLYPLPQPAPTA